MSSTVNFAIIFAGGSGVRMHSGSKPKQFLEHNEKPIIIYTLEIFDRHPEIDGIVISCIKDWIPVLQDQIIRFGLNKVVTIVPGGKTGQESIYNALCAADAFTKGVKTIALVHDGVRPLIPAQLISDNIVAVKQFGNCITCVPAFETFFINKGVGCFEIPDRNNVMVARAPQSFFLNDILYAHRKARQENKEFIDCCTMMSYYGHELHTLVGPMENIKITTPMDFFVFKALIDAENDPQLSSL